MKCKNKKVEWAGCSDYKERREQLSKAHEEFLELINSGYKITGTRHKRPRIKRYQETEPTMVKVTVFGTIKKVSIEVYNRYYKPCGIPYV